MNQILVVILEMAGGFICSLGAHGRYSKTTMIFATQGFRQLLQSMRLELQRMPLAICCSLLRPRGSWHPRQDNFVLIMQDCRTHCSQAAPLSLVLSLLPEHTHFPNAIFTPQECWLTRKKQFFFQTTGEMT